MLASLLDSPDEGIAQDPKTFGPAMMMIAFITIKSSLVPSIEGLCAQIYFRFEISVVSHIFFFSFVWKKKHVKRKQTGS